MLPGRKPADQIAPEADRDQGETTGQGDLRHRLGATDGFSAITTFMVPGRRLLARRLLRENKSEGEVREVHDRYQKIQEQGPGSHSIDDAPPGGH